MTSRTRSASLAIAIRVSLAAVWLTGAAAAMAQVTDPLIRRAEMYTGPNEFLLTSESDKQVLSYDSPLDVRVCNRTRQTSGISVGAAAGGMTSAEQHAVPLTISHDGRSQQVEPGGCALVQSQRVTISPAEPISQGWLLRGSVETAKLGTLGAATQQQSQANSSASGTGASGGMIGMASASSGRSSAGSGAVDAAAGTIDVDSRAAEVENARQAIIAAQRTLSQAQQTLAEAAVRLRDAGERRQAQAGDAGSSNR